MYKFLLILSLFTQSVFSQVCDTILKNDVYNSYISYDLKMVIQVNYTLYKGGGDCDRKRFRFKKGTKIDISSNKQYTKSGYDRGHLANAKDFAYDCEKDEKTFRYYNCLPQTPNLNRGIWKVWETKIRKESQTDSLLLGGEMINVPKSQHWKDIIIKESQWFNVNEQQAYKAMNYCFENYDEVKKKALKLMKTNREKFTLNKMTEKLNEIITSYVDKVPTQVGIQLPKLKKVGKDNSSKIKLPKLKKTSEATV